MSNEVEKNIWIVGDPILDVYLYGTQVNNRFEVSERILRCGGAANTYANLCEILRETNWNVFYTWTCNQGGFKQLVRLIDSQSGHTLEVWPYSRKKSQYYLGLQSLPAKTLRKKKPQKDIVIISDYNKGSINKENSAFLDKYISSLPNFEYAVVDSRYRTTYLPFLRNTKTKIWHATGDEFSEEWASNFEYTIQTNGPGPVKIFERDKLVVDNIPVPTETKVVDVTGAGDTFTAAIGAYLAECEINTDSLKSACEFAISCCQEVIQKQFVATTTHRLHIHPEVT